MKSFAFLLAMGLFPFSVFSGDFSAKGLDKNEYTFECVSLLFENGEYRTYPFPLRSCFLHVFIKQDKKYVFLRNFTNPVYISEYESRLTLPFYIGNVYYLYFSEKQLNRSEIDALCENDKLFLRVEAGLSDSVLFNQSLFSFILFSKMISEKSENIIDDLLKIYNDENERRTGGKIISWINQNKVVMHPNGAAIDMEFVLYGISSFLKGEKPYWKQIEDKIDKEAIALKNKEACFFSDESAWEEAAWRIASPRQMLSARLAAVICNKYGDELKADNNNLMKCLELFFANEKWEEEASNFLSEESESID